MLTNNTFLHSPNIHPLKEYLLRKDENVRFADKHGVPFVDADYDTDNWFACAKGTENEPERSIRCTMSFDMRFERTALYAHGHGFPLVTSSLGISRWKDMAQINECGHRAAAPYAGLAYWDLNWRKGSGSQRMIEISKREHFYQQEIRGLPGSSRRFGQAIAWKQGSSQNGNIPGIRCSRRSPRHRAREQGADYPRRRPASPARPARAPAPA